MRSRTATAAIMMRGMSKLAVVGAALTELFPGCSVGQRVKAIICC